MNPTFVRKNLIKTEMQDITFKSDFKDNWIYFVLINIFRFHARETSKKLSKQFFQSTLTAEQEKNY